MTLDRSLSTVPQLPPLASDHSLGSMSGALPVDEFTHPDESASSQPVPEGGVADESRDKLSVPAPIGKYQPSWDPFNATPIAEEEGFQYDERPKPPRQMSSESTPRQASLNVPRDSISKSDRSNSSDAHFYDAREKQADITNDWVMVPGKDALGGDQTNAESEVKPDAESESKKSLDVPATSILSRPRGSSYGVPSPPPSARSATFSTSPPLAVAPASTSPPVQQVPSTLLSSAKSTPTAPITAPAQPLPQATPQQQPEEQASSSFLPPIRRTSTFGLSIGSRQRQAKQRFPIEDDDDEPIPAPQQNVPENSGADIAAATGAAAGIAAIAHEENNIAEPSPRKPTCRSSHLAPLV
jgi:hypothetical protein